MPSLHTMDTDKDPAPKKKKLADLEEKWKRLKSEAQIQKKVYQERRVEEAQLAKEARNVPLPAEDDSDGSFNSKRNRNVTNRPRDQPLAEMDTMDAVGGDVTMEEHAESEEDYDCMRTNFARDAKEIAAERVKLDKLTMEFNQEMQRGASCYA